MDTDSYTRVLRIKDSFESGHLLDYVQRDNGGEIVPLHWSHLLDGLIILLSLPLRSWAGSDLALHFAGASIGPISMLMLLAITIYCLEHLQITSTPPLAIGMLIGSAPCILAYGAVGRADHHVLILAAVAGCLGLVGLPATTNRRRYFHILAGGALGGLGLWLSPEAFPFIGLGWFICLCRDCSSEFTKDHRNCGFLFSSAFLIVTLFANSIDPSPRGFFSSELDRISWPYVVLAIWLVLVSGAFTFFNSHSRFGGVFGWLVPGIYGLAAVGPWSALYPAVLKGTKAEFSEEAYRRYWQGVSELLPIDSWQRSLTYLFIPGLCILISAVLVVRRSPTPIKAVYFCVGLFTFYLAAVHIRFAVYAEFCGAVALLLILDSLNSQSHPYPAERQSPPASSWPIVIAASVFPYLVGPVADIFGAKPTGIQAAQECRPRLVANELQEFAGKIVLTSPEINPEMIYFSKVIGVGGPYHRAELHLLRTLDALEETSFQNAPPLSFLNTRAQAVLVCTSERYKSDSLAQALAEGKAQRWLEEIHVEGASGLKLYKVLNTWQNTEFKAQESEFAPPVDGRSGETGGASASRNR